MSFDKDSKLRKSLESDNNRFATIKNIGKQARLLSEEYDNAIFHSEAITHIVNGTTPDNKYYFADEWEAEQIKEMFCYIDDVSVKNAVYDSFYASKAKNNLVYMYNDITDSPRKSRVRVLTRMLWYSLYYH